MKQQALGVLLICYVALRVCNGTGKEEKILLDDISLRYTLHAGFIFVSQQCF